jgi:hypothetical protein
MEWPILMGRVCCVDDDVCVLWVMVLVDANEGKSFVTTAGRTKKK